MKPNKYFSIKRFSNLFRNDWLINQKTYLFTLVGLFIATYALLYFSMITTKHVTIDQYTGFIIFYMVGLGVFIGTAFPALNNQIKTSNYLLVPGSTFEKFMVQFVVRIVLFIPIALLIFWICTHLAKSSLIPDPKIGFDPAVNISDFHFKDLYIYTMDNMDILVLFLSIFSVASLLFAGSAYFTRFALVKTLILSGIIVGAVILSFVFFSHVFFPELVHGFEVHMEPYKITETLYNFQLAVYILGGLSWLFFLPLAYFKLKEKEV